MNAAAGGSRPVRLPTTEYVLQLPGDRALGVAEYGDPGGVPVFYCHGFPTCRREAALADHAARRGGVRLIAADRPGYGASSPQPGRRIVDWTRDVAAAADALGIGTFHLLGVSGGAPFALACAALLAERVTKTAIVCGLAPITGAASTRGMITFQRLWLTLARVAPAFSARVMVPIAATLLRHAPRASLVLMRAALPAPDREVLRDPAVASVLTDSLSESVAGGSEGAARDLLLFTRPWGFLLGEIRRPVLLWHGERDRTVPARMGRELADALPVCRSRFLAAEGHFSLPVRHMGPIIDELIKHRRRPPGVNHDRPAGPGRMRR